MITNKMLYSDDTAIHINEEHVEYLKIFKGSDVVVKKKSMLINKYYSWVDRYIKTNQTLNIYFPFISVHTITSADELNFYMNELNYVPLTKKYQYNNININNILDTTNNWEINIDININDLLYNKTLSILFLYNKYLSNTTYLSSLTSSHQFSFKFILSKSSYPLLSDVTTTEFLIELQDKLNCVLFNDFIVYDAINNNKTMMIISPTLHLGGEFHIILDGIDGRYYMSESTQFNNSYNVVNTDSTGTIINNIDLDYGYDVLYKNFVYINNYSNGHDIKKLININNVNLVQQDIKNVDYIVSNNFIFNNYNTLTSIQLRDITLDGLYNCYSDYNILSDYIFTDNTTDKTFSISTSINNELFTIATYKHNTIYQKYNTIIHSSNPMWLHNISTYIRSNVDVVNTMASNVRSHTISSYNIYNKDNILVSLRDNIINLNYIFYNSKNYNVVNINDGIHINNILYNGNENYTHINTGNDFTLTFAITINDINCNIIIGDFFKYIGGTVYLLNSIHNIINTNVHIGNGDTIFNIIRYSNGILKYTTYNGNGISLFEFDGTCDISTFDSSKIQIYHYIHNNYYEVESIVHNLSIYDYKLSDIILNILKMEFVEKYTTVAGGKALYNWCT